MQRLTEWNRDHTHAQVGSHANAIDKLAEYEDLEEQGLLLKLPCKVGDTLYVPTRTFISEFVIRYIGVSKCHNIFYHTCLTKGINMTGETFSEDKIGKTVFLTQAEAYEALKKMNETEE